MWKPMKSSVLVALPLLFGLNAAGCGASFAPPATVSGLGAAASGQTEVALHGLGAQDGVWQGDVRLPLRPTDDAVLGVVGHQLPGDSRESFTLGQLAWRHRFAEVEQRWLPSAGVGIGLGVGGHNRAWGDEARSYLAGAVFADLGMRYRALDWLQLFGLMRVQQGAGLTGPADQPRAPATTWVQAVLGARADVGPALVAVAWSAAHFWNVDDEEDVSGPMLSVGWRF